MTQWVTMIHMGHFYTSDTLTVTEKFAAAVAVLHRAIGRAEESRDPVIRALDLDELLDAADEFEVMANTPGADYDDFEDCMDGVHDWADRHNVMIGKAPTYKGPVL